MKQADGARPERVLISPAVDGRLRDCTGGACSPNQRHLLLACARDLLTVTFSTDDTSGTPPKVTPFVVNEYTQNFPAFSPDGRWVAYVSNHGGRGDVYVRPFPDPGPELALRAGGSRPSRWLGRSLLLWTNKGPIAVEVKTHPSLQAGQPKRLLDRFEYRVGPGTLGFEVAPDGQRFLVMKRNRTPQALTRLHVVLNWMEEVRRKLQQR